MRKRLLLEVEKIAAQEFFIPVGIGLESVGQDIIDILIKNDIAPKVGRFSNKHRARRDEKQGHHCYPYRGCCPSHGDGVGRGLLNRIRKCRVERPAERSGAHAVKIRLNDLPVGRGNREMQPRNGGSVLYILKRFNQMFLKGSPALVSVDVKWHEPLGQVSVVQPGWCEEIGEKRVILPLAQQSFQRVAVSV